MSSTHRLQLFALDYGGSFRSFVLEVDRGTEPIRSHTGRKSVKRMIEQYERLVTADRLRIHYQLKSPLLLLFACTSPDRLASFSELIAVHAPNLRPMALFQTLQNAFPRYDASQSHALHPWQKVALEPQKIIPR